MIIARAPLRIPLGGGGTDFPGYYLKYGGYVLGFALDKYVHVVIHDTIDDKIRLKYSKTEVVDDVDKLENRVAAEALKWYGVTEGIEVATFSDVPESSGLGGSSAFCVALVAALRKKIGMKLDKREIFASSYDIERVRAHQLGGMQDQYFASFGGAWSLDLGQEFTREPVCVTRLLPKLKLVYTNTFRPASSIADDQTSRTSAGDSATLKSLDSTKELGYQIRNHLVMGEVEAVGRLFNEHWEVKKSRDGRITNSEVDRVYEVARGKGALGGKLLGIGGSGYLLLYSEGSLKGMDCIPVGLDTEGVKVVYQNG